MTHKFSELRDKIRSDPKRAARIDRLTREVSVLITAVQFIEKADRNHMPFCGVSYQNSSPCSCGLPELRAAVQLLVDRDA